MFKNLETLREQIQAFGLHRLEEKIVNLAQPCIQMMGILAHDASIPSGASKLGGLPDFQWPYRNDGAKPLTFMAQFNFSEIAPYDKTGLLPQRGILACFYDVDSTPWGFHNQTDSWRVIYVQDETTPLHRTAHPAHAGQ